MRREVKPTVRNETTIRIKTSIPGAITRSEQKLVTHAFTLCSTYDSRPYCNRALHTMTTTNQV
jgi:hypothetical protein